MRNLFKKIKAITGSIFAGVSILVGMFTSPLSKAQDNISPDAYYEESLNPRSKAQQNSPQKAAGAQKQLDKYKSNPSPTLFVRDQFHNPLLDSQDHHYIDYAKSCNPERAMAHSAVIRQIKKQNLPSTTTHNNLMYDIKELKSNPHFLKARQTKNILKGIKQRGEIPTQTGQTYTASYENVIDHLKALKNHPEEMKIISPKVPGFLADYSTNQKIINDPWNIEKERAAGNYDFANYLARLKAEVGQNSKQNTQKFFMEPLSTTVPVEKKAIEINKTSSISIFTDEWIEKERKSGNIVFANYLLDRKNKHENTAETHTPTTNKLTF
ncbi:MAG: hypothetical protein K0S11_1231 [Gammaproteobacteria bacterium]|jgi:hypothetical protein|nr:hypothetical protein [Gammaproteobacteria bacterium]